jgi:hypothetical protein
LSLYDPTGRKGHTDIVFRFKLVEGESAGGEVDDLTHPGAEVATRTGNQSIGVEFLAEFY